LAGWDSQAGLAVQRRHCGQRRGTLFVQHPRFAGSKQSLPVSNVRGALLSGRSAGSQRAPAQLSSAAPAPQTKAAVWHRCSVPPALSTPPCLCHPSARVGVPPSHPPACGQWLLQNPGNARPWRRVVDRRATRPVVDRADARSSSSQFPRSRAASGRSCVSRQSSASARASVARP